MSGLTRKDADNDGGKSYAMLLADTVVCKPGGAPPDVATALAPKDWKEVAYYLKVRWSGSTETRVCTMGPAREHVDATRRHTVSF